MQLQEGDRLFLYTDGLPEQVDPEGQHYGETRLAAALYDRSLVSLEQTCREVVAEVQRFAGKAGCQDDMTLIGIEYSNREPAGLAT